MHIHPLHTAYTYPFLTHRLFIDFFDGVKGRYGLPHHTLRAPRQMLRYHCAVAAVCAHAHVCIKGGVYVWIFIFVYLCVYIRGGWGAKGGRWVFLCVDLSVSVSVCACVCTACVYEVCVDMQACVWWCPRPCSR